MKVSECKKRNCRWLRDACPNKYTLWMCDRCEMRLTKIEKCPNDEHPDHPL